MAKIHSPISTPEPELVQPGAAANGPLPLRFFPQGFHNPGMRPPAFLCDTATLAAIQPPAVVKTFNERLCELSQEERDTYAEFRAHVCRQGWDAEGVTEWETLRYLIARNYDLEKATKMLKKTIEWRREYQPNKRWCTTCQADPASHMQHFCGWDSLHRPVLYSTYRFAKCRVDGDKNLEHSIMSFRHLDSLMPVGVEQWVCITDFVTFSAWRDGRSNIGRKFAEVLGAHFPERLALQILVDAPKSFSVLYKLISPFVDDKTKAKVRFWYTDKQPNIRDEFPKIFPPHLAEYLVQAFLENKAAGKKSKHDNKENADADASSDEASSEHSG